MLLGRSAIGIALGVGGAGQGPAGGVGRRHSHVGNRHEVSRHQSLDIIYGLAKPDEGRALADSLSVEGPTPNTGHVSGSATSCSSSSCATISRTLSAGTRRAI